MPKNLQTLKQTIHQQANAAKAKVLMTFFKTGKGEYAQGDKFLGLTVPLQRSIAKQYHALSLKDLQVLLKSPWHEERLIALIILVMQFKKSDEKARRCIYEFYLKNTLAINNWDLVDLSAYHIVGAFLEDKDKTPLFDLAKSRVMWERRIAMVSCFHFIRLKQTQPALSIAKVLLKDPHDLMHKAVGWMLREVGKRASEAKLEEFLKANYDDLPRTALRYAIERFPEAKRQQYLKKDFN